MGFTKLPLQYQSKEPILKISDRQKTVLDKPTWIDSFKPRNGKPLPRRPDDNEDALVPYRYIKHSTQSAYLLQIGERDVWFPKNAIIIDEENNVICAPKRLLRLKHLVP
jgi:hypothetical protein